MSVVAMAEWFIRDGRQELVELLLEDWRPTDRAFYFKDESYMGDMIFWALSKTFWEMFL